jgi:hypothetical protein
VAWTAALHSFYNNVEAEITQFYGDRSTPDKAKMLGSFEESFPLVLNKL